MNKFRVGIVASLVVFFAVGVNPQAPKEILIAQEAPKVKKQPVDPPTAPTISLPEKVEGDPSDYIRIPATTNGKSVQWLVTDNTLKLFPIELLKDTKVAVVSSGTPGEYKVYAWTALADVPSAPAICTVTVRGARPPPKPPDPPNPPKPPDPPKPNGAIIPDAGFHALIVFDSKVTNPPPEHGSILYGNEVRSYLNSKCVKVAGSPDRRIWDANLDVSGDPSGPMKAMYARKRGSVPWIVLSRDGVAGFEGPLPATVAETMVLLRKVAEGK